MELLGREAELAAIDEVLASARAGRGRALFVTGEAGIGKSSVLAVARERAGDALVLDGAAWESPGAPPYWPWIQVLRTAGLAELIEGTSRVSGDAGADPAAARFALIDSVARALVARASERELVIVLDDLHAADLPSLELLELLCRELPRTPIALCGAWREAELASRPDAARRLARVGRHAQIAPLRPLTADEVTRWVGADGAVVHATSEGNPLFVEELMRARRSGGPARGIGSVLEDHLALVTPATRAVLSAASVLGRELDLALLPALVSLDDDAVAHSLREATEAGLGERRDACWVFRHVLLRDLLYGELTPSRRATLHRAAGDVLDRVLPGSVSAAHHLLAGVAGADVERAVAAARAAAARAIEVHAFEDAAALLAAALRALESVAAADVALRVDLRLDLARARQGYGAAEAAQVEAIRAADLARSLGDAPRLARSALAYAAELASGRRDPVMIDLLREAHTALPEGDTPLQARVTARLAAALVPTPDASDLRPYALAEEAVAMAARLGDAETRMYAQRFAVHAHGFRLGIAEALPRAREVIALSDHLARPLEAVEHRTWLINANLTAGDLAGADLATESLAALLSPHAQPHYRWRMPIIRAARATLSGDFDAAERHIASVRQLARDHDLDRARMCCAFAMLSLALVSRSQARALAAVDDVRAVARGVGGPIGSSVLASVLAMAGRLDEARRELASIAFVPPMGLSLFGSEAALLVDDKPAMARWVQPLRDAARRAPLAGGASMSVMLAPVDVIVGELLVQLGRHDEALEPLERGHVLSRRLASPGFIERASAALAAAREVRPLAPVAVSALADPVAELPAPPTTTLDLERVGDHVRVRFRGRELRVPPLKGLEYLATLVARPHAELHVSDLAGDEDRGDAGEVLDASARAAYKARAEELREELELAQARNDLGRIDRLTAELDMLADQLVASTGLGGRSRRAGSRVERARVNVQRRIRDAIRRLAAEDAALGRHLDATIRTGTFCSFTPLEP